jgi:hypothetical protein
MFNCVNLRAKFGDRWKITFEPSYYADRGPLGRTDDPWLQQIECVHGTICPWGDDKLGACTKHRGPVASQLAALDCVTVAQEGTDGSNATFHIDDIEIIAEVMKPRRKRQVSPAMREHLRNIGATTRFSPEHGVGAPNQALKSTIAPRGVSEVTQGRDRAF